MTILFLFLLTVEITIDVGKNISVSRRIILVTNIPKSGTRRVCRTHNKRNQNTERRLTNTCINNLCPGRKQHNMKKANVITEKEELEETKEWQQRRGIIRYLFHEVAIGFVPLVIDGSTI